MSDTNKRKRPARQTDSKGRLLDELDSLKELLIEQKRQLDSTDAEIPMLNEVVDIAPDETEASIPVLEEVAFPPEDEAAGATATESLPHSDNNRETSSPLDEQELSKLIDMLVGHRLRRLRPKIKEEVLEELQRLYPELFRH